MLFRSASYAANAGGTTNTGSFTGSFVGVHTGSLLGTSSWAQTASLSITASYALNATATVPAGTISSSTQFKTLTDPFTGSFTGSFKGDGSQLTGIGSTLALSSSLNIDTYTFVGNGVIKNYVISQSYDPSSLLVAVDGLSQTNILDYTLTGNTVSFVTAPIYKSTIRVVAGRMTINVINSVAATEFDKLTVLPGLTGPPPPEVVVVVDVLPPPVVTVPSVLTVVVDPSV